MNVDGVLIPVPALTPALRVLRDVLQLPLRFSDADRYAAFDARLKLAVAADDERIVEAPALVIRVDDLDAALRRLIAEGADVRRAAEQGPHERRAVVRLAGIDLLLSQTSGTAHGAGA